MGRSRPYSTRPGRGAAGSGPRPSMSLVIEAIGGTPVAERRIEVVERKGIGHPDTICDSVAEAAAVALARMYLEPARRHRPLQHRQGAAGGRPVRQALRRRRGDAADRADHRRSRDRRPRRPARAGGGDGPRRGGGVAGRAPAGRASGNGLHHAGGVRAGLRGAAADLPGGRRRDRLQRHVGRLRLRAAEPDRGAGARGRAVPQLGRIQGDLPGHRPGREGDGRARGRPAGRDGGHAARRVS